MAKNQVVAWGDYQFEVGFASTEHKRDVKTIYVDEAGQQVSAQGVVRSPATARPRVAAGLEKAVQVGDSVIRLPGEELDAIVERSKAAHEVMEVLETIDYRDVPTERIVGSKWVTALNGSGKALAMIARGLEESRRVAVVKWLSTSREKIGVLRPRKTSSGTALLLIELSFANDYAEPPETALLDGIETVAGEVAASIRLIRAFARPRGGERKIDTASDTAVDARWALVDSLTPSIEDALAEVQPERELV